VPDIVPAAGNGFTVTGATVRQPVTNVYVTFAVPELIPETTPVDEPMVAIAELLLLQIPPPASLNVVLALTHTVFVPLIAAGKELTVTGVVITQPVGSM
jgi:hypothetical protein